MERIVEGSEVGEGFSGVGDGWQRASLGGMGRTIIPLP